MAEVLGLRARNRSTLARQLLLERSDMPVLDAVAHLVGLQAQVPRNPYVALWSRLARFRPGQLEDLLLDRAVVRAVVLRGTLHLVTADDCLTMRPLVQPVLDAEMDRHPDFGPLLGGIDLEPVVRFGREVLSEQPRTNPRLRALMAERFPDLDPGALAFACRNRLCLVQVPPRGLWTRSGQVTTATAEAWLGRPLAPAPSIDELVLRYVAAFGPVTPADAAVWTRLTGLREVFDRLRPRLRTCTDEAGRELFDVPDAPRPDPDTPAPVRFLPEYDNVLLSHADRSRVVPDGVAALFADPRGVKGTVLWDGFLRATWVSATDPAAGTAVLRITHAGLPKRAISAVEAEGRRFLRFLHPGLAGEVRSTAAA